MKYYSNIFYILFMLCSGYSQLSLADSAAELQVIADGRLPFAEVDQHQWLNHPGIVQASDEAREYWRKRNTVYEDAFRIMASAEGAFTAPDRHQVAVLYLLSRWPRCCSNMGLAILEADKLIRNIVFAGSTHHLVSVADLNDDGLDELALVSSFGMGGSNETSVGIVSLSEQSTVLLGRFPLIQDDCATASEHSERHSFRISYSKNAADRFAVAHYRSGCEEMAKNELVSVDSRIMEAVDVSEEYLDLPIN